MDKKRRKTGIGIMGDVPWGAHLCLFYHSKRDLTDVLVPFFKAGLENNEFCMWVTSEPLNVEDAKKELNKKLKNLDSYIKKGQIEILDYSKWYIKSGNFDSKKVLQGWIEKERQALKKGFDGFRLTGNTFWLEKKNWRDFTDYEASVNSIIGKYRMLALCAYPLEKCGASEIMDVVSNHQSALIKREGRWEIIESSERKHVKKMLQASEKRFKNLIETITDWVWEVDKNGVYTYVSPKIKELLGYKVSEVLGKTPFDLMPKKEAEKISKFFKEKAVKGESFYQLENINRHKNGHLVILETSGIPIWDEKDQLKGYRGIDRDITERKQAEEKMRDLAKFPDEDANPVLRVTEGGKILYANRSSAPLLNLWGTREGKKIPGFLIKKISGIMDSGISDYIMQEYNDRIFSILCIPIKDNGYANLYARDITELKEAQEKLKKAKEDTEKQVEERTKELAEEKIFVSDVLANIAEGIVVFDPHGRLIDINHAFCSMTGFSKAELKGQKFPQDFLPKNEAELIKSNLGNILSMGSGKFEMTGRKKDGSKFPVIVTPSVLKDEKGKITAYITIVQDITKSKRDETEKERLKKKLEEYAKRLEIKVKRLEKKKLNLTDNEKRVFYSLIKWPHDNDIQLSEKTSIKRSTITAIRNKLLRQNWIIPVNIPNFSSLEFELVCISYGRASDSKFARKFKVMDSRFRTPEAVLMYSTHRDFISFSFFRNFIDAQTFEPLNRNIFNNNDRGQNSICLPLGLCNRFKLMDFSECVRGIFKLDKKPGPEPAPVKPASKLTEKEKKIFYALVKFPQMNIKGLSELLNIAVPTITKARNKLMKEGLLRRVVIPNIKKLDQPLLFIHAIFNPEKDNKLIEEYKRKISEEMNEFINIGQGNHVIMFSIFNDFHSEKESKFHELLEEMHRTGYLVDYPDIIVLPAKSIRLQKMDFASVMKKALDIETEL